MPLVEVLEYMSETGLMPSLLCSLKITTLEVKRILPTDVALLVKIEPRSLISLPYHVEVIVTHFSAS